MREAIVEKLRRLKLSGFLAGLTEQSESVLYQDMSFDDRLDFLLDKEVVKRDNQNLAKRLSRARLKQAATVEQLDFKATRGLSKSEILTLCTGDWVKAHHHLIITGATGAGKTFLTCAIADRLCKNGFSVRYLKATELISDILISKADGSFKKLIASLKSVDVLVFDEWLRDPLGQAEAREVLDLLDDRFRIASCIFTTQLPVADWYLNIKDPTLAEAILDRVVHDALRLQVSGDSMRKATATVSAKEFSMITA